MVYVCCGLIFLLSNILTAFLAIRNYRQRSDMGNLVISDNPNDEFMSLELKSNPNEVLKRKYIFLWVKRR